MEIADIDDIKKAARESANIVAPQLKGYNAKLNKRGKTFALNGGLCTTICMVGPASSPASTMCMRCWYRMPGDPNMLARMKTIADGLHRLRSTIGRYFITYEIVERMLNVGGKVIPGLLMEWLDAETLSDYICDESGHSAADIARVASRFVDMCQVLNNARISHGDLSGGNVMVMRDGSLKLIDYDSVYFESMGSRSQAVAGDDAYQHPGRKSYKSAAVFADYFSQHLIYVSLLIISRNMAMRPPHGDKNMAFVVTDLINERAFKSSRAYKEGMALNDPVITAELTIMANALRGAYEKVPPLMPQAAPERPQNAPLAANYCTACGFKFPDAGSASKTYVYCTQCGAKRLTI